MGWADEGACTGGADKGPRWRMLDGSGGLVRIESHGEEAFRDATSVLCSVDEARTATAGGREFVIGRRAEAPSDVGLGGL